MLWARRLEDWVEVDFCEKPLEVGVVGLVTWLEDGEGFCSFDRIFFRKPSAGMKRSQGRGGWCDRG